MTNASVLVIAPHALDEVLGCGGTIALEASAGRKIDILVLFGDGTGLDGQRRAAAKQAAVLLGAAQPRFAGFPENRGDTVPLGSVVDVIFGRGTMYKLALAISVGFATPVTVTVAVSLAVMDPV